MRPLGSEWEETMSGRCHREVADVGAVHGLLVYFL